LAASEHAAHSAAVSRHFFTSPLVLRGRTVGVYLAQDGELDLAPLLARLLRTRTRLALPVVGRSGLMTFRHYNAHTRLTPNRFGIPEPTAAAAPVAPMSLDLLLMPLVAFDRFGVRLGMGAGYYDRFLGALPPAMRPRLAGVAHEVQRSLDPLPLRPWDVPLDGVLTETGWRPSRETV